MNKGWTYCGGNTFCCCDSISATCNTAMLLQSPIQDPELADASNRINQILDEIREHNQDSNRELALLGIPKERSDGTVLLLAWVTPGVSVDSNVDEVRRVLL
jgi:hypothetical protein